jgi:2'-5' RNA ligase
VAVEFRNTDWLCSEVYGLLDRCNAALCLADMERCPITEPNDVSFVYVRRHGPGGSHQGRYTSRHIAADAERIHGWLEATKDVYVYCLLQQRRRWTRVGQRPPVDRGGWMSEKTHKTAVVFIPPDDCWQPIQAIRRRYDRQFRRWMPHVTLLYPFCPRGRFDEMEPALRNACRRIEPFEVRLAEFHHFHHGRARHTLWLAPEPRETVICLQAALASAAPDYEDVARHADGFTPHLSVGQVVGRDALADLKTSVQASWQALSCPARQVSLIWRDEPPDDVFRVDRSIALGS